MLKVNQTFAIPLLRSVSALKVEYVKRNVVNVQVGECTALGGPPIIKAKTKREESRKCKKDFGH